MSDRDALLSAICAQPDEDTPRLVFADYLEEHDEAARAAFVRDQVQLARTPPWEPFAVRCRWRSPDGLNGAGFRSTLPKLDGSAVEWAAEPFRRGFGWWLKVRTVALWDALAAPLFERQPIGKLAFWNTTTLDDWRRVAASGPVRHFREVAFNASPIEPLFALRDAPGAAGITDLYFVRASGAGMPEVIEDLFRSHLGQVVRGLHFHMGYESLDALVDALNTGGPLARLAFSSMGITGSHLRRLFDGPSASELTELHFTQELLESDGLRVLAEALPRTTRDLTLVGIGTRRTDGLEALARSDRFAGLRRLNLSSNPLTPRAVKVLALSHALGALRALDLTNCHIGDKGLRHVTQAKWWHGLVEVNLRGNSFSPAGVKHLLNAPVPPDLAALVIERHTLGPEGRAALVQKFGPAAVFVASEPPG
ncbi:MAG TPA: TIGR02996 domain-containing protein [Gemmata sp.]